MSDDAVPTADAGSTAGRGRSASVALIGFMGAGKSAVGRLLARRLGVPFSDTDELVERRHGPIAALFATRGEATFRELEREVVLAELARAAEAAGVVSLGGGAVTDGDVREALTRLAHVAWLDAPPRVLFARAAGSERPLARDEASFVALYERRRPLYEACATVRVVNDGRRPADEVATELAEAVA